MRRLVPATLFCSECARNIGLRAIRRLSSSLTPLWLIGKKKTRSEYLPEEHDAGPAATRPTRQSVGRASSVGRPALPEPAGEPTSSELACWLVAPLLLPMLKRVPDLALGKALRKQGGELAH